MKTEMQEMLEFVHDEVQLFGSARQILINKVKEMIEKEKDVMCGIYDDAIAEFDPTYIGTEKYGEQYYNETYGGNKWAIKNKQQMKCTYLASTTK